MRTIIVLLLTTTLIIACGNMRIDNKNQKASVDWYFQQDNAEMAQAIFEEDTDEIARLVEEGGYNVNTRDSIERGVRTYQWTYLNYAVSKDKTKSVKTLLNLGADINKLLLIDDTAYSNINLASQHGNHELIKLLLKHGIVMDHTIAASPLDDLMLNGHYDEKLFDSFIKHGADVNHPMYVSRIPPLITAYDINNFDAVDYLLEHGADPLQISTFGNSFVSELDQNIKDNIKADIVQAYKKRLTNEYGIQFPVEVSYRKGIEQAIKRYENATAKEKEIMGASELERIDGLRESLATGFYNDIPID